MGSRKVEISDSAGELSGVLAVISSGSESSQGERSSDPVSSTDSSILTTGIVVKEAQSWLVTAVSLAFETLLVL